MDAAADAAAATVAKIRTVFYANQMLIRWSATDPDLYDSASNFSSSLSAGYAKARYHFENRSISVVKTPLTAMTLLHSPSC